MHECVECEDARHRARGWARVAGRAPADDELTALDFDCEVLPGTPADHALQLAEVHELLHLRERLVGL